MNEQECNAKGGKLVDGKCEMPNFVPSSSGFKVKKKSNSPFRMWGSWIGAGIGFSLGIFGAIISTLGTSVLASSPKIVGYGLYVLILPIEILSYLRFIGTIPTIPILFFIFIIVEILYGFLFGWGITVLWRKYKK